MSQVMVTDRNPLRCNPFTYPCDLCDLCIEQLVDRGYWGMRGVWAGSNTPPFIWKQGHRGQRSQAALLALGSQVTAPVQPQAAATLQGWPG